MFQRVIKTIQIVFVFGFIYFISSASGCNGGPCNGSCGEGYSCCPDPAGIGGTCCHTATQYCSSTGGENPGPVCYPRAKEELEAAEKRDGE